MMFISAPAVRSDPPKVSRPPNSGSVMIMLQPLATVEVREIIGARLAKVAVLDGREVIRAGDRLKVIESEP